MEALVEAREQKMVRFLGLTGHHRPDVADGGHPPLPVRRDPAGPQRRRPAPPQLLERSSCRWRVEKQMGIIGMKITGRGRILSSWTPPPPREQKRSWEGVRDRRRPGTLEHARGHVLHALAARSAPSSSAATRWPSSRRTWRWRATFTPLSDRADGGARGEGRARLEAGALLPLLRAGLTRRSAAIEGAHEREAAGPGGPGPGAVAPRPGADRRHDGDLLQLSPCSWPGPSPCSRPRSPAA